MANINKALPILRFPEFYNKWELKFFSDVVKVNQGLAILRSERFLEYAENRLPYITIPALEGKRIEYIENPKTSVICEKEDIIITRTGSGLGQIWTNNYGVFHNNFFKVEPINKKEVVKRFLYYYLLTNTVQRKMWVSAGVGAIPDLNHSDFYSIPYYKTEFKEQQKIASFLTDVDDKITKLTKKKTLLEQYKKGIMQKTFSQALRFKDDNGNEFPKWELKKLSDLGVTLNGLTGKTKENFGSGKLYIQYKQIFDSSKINIEDCGFVEITPSDNQTKMKYGDVFFTTSSETPNEIGTASVLLDEVEEMYLNSFCFGFRVLQSVLYPSFSQFLFRSNSFRKKMIPLAQGSTRYNISKSSFLKLKVYLPSIEEQIKIANFLSDIDVKIEVLNTKIEHSKSFKKGLLQKMFV
ncbi:restriction endonuclease subunit S [Winogradskyella algicola]|uniref:restriction endonuclease subunit S n=1 Tax=Winogradskyella algicola TaxID=2575815 RepID=UPI001108CB4F|nr:restriction endonuclease subunit S [Winogradskyella algicola]